MYLYNYYCIIVHFAIHPSMDFILCHCRILDLGGPLIFGHLPQSFQYGVTSFATPFEGCIRNVRLNTELVDFSEPLFESNVGSGCQSNRCSETTCKNSGQCLGTMTNFDCICSSSFAGTDCTQGQLALQSTPAIQLAACIHFIHTGQITIMTTVIIMHAFNFCSF